MWLRLSVRIMNEILPGLDLMHFNKCILFYLIHCMFISLMKCTIIIEWRTHQGLGRGKSPVTVRCAIRLLIQHKHDINIAKYKRVAT